MAPDGPKSAEDRLIAAYFRPLATHPGALKLTDDTALLTPPAGHDLVLTADAVIGGVHFFPADEADMVAKKALRVNLSDLAAKGAKPLGFLLTLALPKAVPETWVELFARGLGTDAEQYECPLLGGDSVRTTGPIAISITALGSVPANTMVRRSGAQAGDAVMVTGTIGDAALGLELRDAVTAAKRWKLDNKFSYQLMRRYLLPQPRNALAEAIRLNASAAMDVSDGLVGDLGKLCDVSGVSADIDVARVPLSEAATSVVASEAAAIEKVLTGGDDYEIVCTVPQERLADFRAAADAARVPVADIGRVTAARAPPRFLGRDGKPMKFKQTSFSHF
ncbi:MAG: thiamine-phosphate kinase [Xanthobacteraceae bacterium]|nr:thiamine-phosphate kinase [Xanthobacteraceae bacterium]